MRRKASFSQNEFDDENIINLTPLIDVVFVVLVAFILIAPMLNIDLVDLAEGASHQKETLQKSSPLKIVVKKDNTILCNNQLVDIENLSSKLSAYKKDHPYITPQLFHDKEAHFGTYQAIKNLAEKTGFKEIQVVLQP